MGTKPINDAYIKGLPPKVERKMQLTFLFVTVGAVVVALIAYATIYAVLRRLVRANSTAIVVVNYTAQPAKLVLPLLALKLTLPGMLEGLRDNVFLSEFVTILLTLSLTWLVMR